MSITALAEQGAERKASKKDWAPEDPSDPSECAGCGTPRPKMLCEFTGDYIWSPTVGTMWELHLYNGGRVMTCSALCRASLKLHESPFDRDMPW